MTHKRASKREVQVLVTPDRNRIVRYHRDLVGNDLTAVLQWCEKHHEPVWVYNDGSWTCPQTVVVEWDTSDHVIVAGPWEQQGGDAP